MIWTISGIIAQYRSCHVDRSTSGDVTAVTRYYPRGRTTPLPESAATGSDAEFILIRPSSTRGRRFWSADVAPSGGQCHNEVPAFNHYRWSIGRWEEYLLSVYSSHRSVFTPTLASSAPANASSSKSPQFPHTSSHRKYLHVQYILTYSTFHILVYPHLHSLT